MSDTVLEIAAVPRLVRLRAMGRLGVRMMFHDRLKFIGTISGVVFAVLLAVQQLSILFALLNRNTQFVDNAGADIFIVPPNTRLLQPGEKLDESVLYQARSTPGVLEAQPLVFAAGTLAKPDGGSESVTLIGFESTSRLGGRPGISSAATRATSRSPTPSSSRTRSARRSARSTWAAPAS
ncbi:MAG: hypothetical protein IPG17_01825 [Sandaracinaceae bacterium]|nr:hypothetical protein [Sandaracinaceae bacterium]